jgi:hypothetical protein
MSENRPLLETRKDLFLEIARGLIDNHRAFNGYGERVNVQTTAQGEDLWRGAATTIPLPNQAVGEQMTVVSSANTDGAAGKTGVNTIAIHYLDADGVEQEETLTMNGTTGVDTTATDIKFVQEIHALTVGSTGVSDGDIKIYRKGDAGRIYCMIATGGNMSLVINRMVPANKTLYITGWHLSVSGKVAQDQQLSVRLRSTDHDGILIPGVFIFKDVVYLKNGAVSIQFKKYIKIPQLSIVKVSAWADVANAECSAYFEGILVDN